MLKLSLASLLAAGAAVPVFAQNAPYAPNNDDIVVTATRSGDAIATNLIGSSSR